MGSSGELGIPVGSGPRTVLQLVKQCGEPDLKRGTCCPRVARIFSIRFAIAVYFHNGRSWVLCSCVDMGCLLSLADQFMAVL